jgi:ferredoxin
MSTSTKHLCVDYDRCEGHGQCVFMAPGLLHLDDDGRLFVDQADVSDCVELAEKAVGACPTSALSIK